MATQTLPARAPGEVVGERLRTVDRPRTARRPIRFLKRLARNVWDHDIDDVGAMMAYYAVMSLFPMLVFIVTIAMLVLDQATVFQGLTMATSAVPGAVGDLVVKQVTGLMHAAKPGFAIGSAALALWGASRGTSALMNALNSASRKPETRSWIRRQVTAIAVTLGVALLIVVALGLLVIGPLIGHWITDRFGLGATFDVGWNIGRWVGAGGLVLIVWATLYRFLPNTDAPFRLFTRGAVIGVLLWLGISYGFGLYLANFRSYESTYGALGGAIMFLTWLWLSNIALLFGAEINNVLVDLRSEEAANRARFAAT